MSSDIGEQIITADIDGCIYVSIQESVNYTQHQSPNITLDHLLQYKQYIIIIDEEKGIYRHNIYNKQYSWEKLTDIPKDLPFGDWTSFIDQLTGKIYITMIQPWSDIDELSVCDEDIASVAIYDIPNNEWYTNPNSWENSTDCLTFKGPLSIQYIPSPHNKLHIIDTDIGTHSMYDDKTHSFQSIHDTLSFVEERDNLIYVETVQKLFVFGCLHKNIYFADIMGPKQTDFKWKKSMIKLPTNCLNALLVFDRIVMFWSNDCDVIEKSIWFLDVYRNELMKSEYIFPNDVNIDSLIKSEDGYLHGIDDENKHHIKINLYELLPAQLINSYIERIDQLITGFLKESQIPTDVINLLRRLFLPPVL